ncbi:uncharacterized protein LOC134207505 [Armigeres subalbatus]|uniref:uncharacterized protein LOC134207505 n=1 Tax=Armigeres subalbatus TaxID=124917 RepID=UPI002ED50573
MLFVLPLIVLAHCWDLVPPTNPSSDLLVHATAEILLDSFIRNADTVFVTTLLEREDLNLIDGIVSRIDQLMPLAIQSIPQQTTLTFKQRYNLLLLDSWQSIERLHAFLRSKQFDFTGCYLMVVTQSESDCAGLANALLELTSDLLIYDANVLCSQNGTINLRTYFPYGHPNHPKPHIEKWNTYSSGGFIRARPHYPRKLENFFGLPLRVALFDMAPFMMLIRNSNRKIVDYDGIEGQLLKELSRSLNMTIEPAEPFWNSGERWGTLAPNGSASGAVSLVLNGTVDMAISFFGNDPLRQKFMLFSKSYFQSALVLIVSPGTEYGTFEKLLLPFQFTLWIGFVIVFFNGLLTILVLQHFPLPVQQFVYGRENRDPLMNFYKVTLGYSVDPLPSRNFGRFLVTLWIIATFILRTAYQEQMFIYLHRQMNHSTVRGWDQFVSDGYRIFINPSVKYAFEDASKHVKESIKFIPHSEYSAILQEIRHARVRGARLSYLELVEYLNQEALIDGGPFYEQFNERLYSYSIHVFFPKNSPLVDCFDSHIQPLVTHGFIQHWTHSVLKRNLLQSVQARARQALLARPLMLKMLTGVFGLYGAGIISAGLTFVAENTFAYCRQHRMPE